ncbi:MAG: thiamine pyrophosphate-binding protein [Chloroflexi bacterium]|nr:thiamine pyrophosphate-binding protein [Chloroflexota bacterium]MYF80917.1 thiamine pyrophosphate-binding protein [Chloroflexota bacterium]MYI05021.1 thiamine pyrophosphate-binding protein [Chloroflexota bacterium]
MTAQSIPADLLLSAIRDAGVQDVVLVPDTHQRTVLDLLMDDDEIRTIHCSTEDEAIAVSAGLIIGGRRPMMQIQHAGLYASVNNLRGVGLDGQFPIVMLIGLLGRDPELDPEDDDSSMVRLCRPLLETLDIPSHLLDGPDELHRIAEAFDEAAERHGPVALLVGTTTS